MEIDFFCGIDIKPSSSNSEDLISEIKTKLPHILSSVFSLPIKQKIQNRQNSLNFACPYCLDSAKDRTAKRGNIYFNNFAYKCYNCDIFTNVKDMFYHFGYPIGLEYYDLIQTKYEENLTKRANLDVLHDLYFIQENSIDRDKFSLHFGLLNPMYEPKAKSYLLSRNQDSALDTFLYDPRQDDMYSLNLDRNGNILGAIIRHNDKKKQRELGRRFSTLNYSDICNKMGIEKDPMIIDYLNPISMIYNILRVDYNRLIYAFEGAYDSNHIANSVAVLSATAKLSLYNVYYIYDNSLVDPTGFKKTEMLLNSGQYVFLWRKFCRENPMYQYCKDFDDCWKIRPIDHSLMIKYFSNDSMDVLEI